MKFKEGDKVVVKTCLKPGKYAGIDFTSSMINYAGKTLTIKLVDKCNKCYHVEETTYIWSEPMLDPIAPIHLLDQCFVMEDDQDNCYVVYKSANGTLGFTTEDEYEITELLCEFDENLNLLNPEESPYGGNWDRENDPTKIVAIYGLPSDLDYVNYPSAHTRKAVWTRPTEIKELTMDEIAKLAGVPVFQLKIKKD